MNTEQRSVQNRKVREVTIRYYSYTSPLAAIRKWT